MGFLSDLISAPLYAFIALMIFIIVLVFIFRFTRKSNLVASPFWSSLPSPKAKPKQEKMVSHESYDQKTKVAINEVYEHFQVCNDPDEIKKITENTCEGQDTFSYATNEYGAPGMDYKAWVTSQSVGDDVIKNHQQYIADRTTIEGGGSGAYFTGRTMSPDSHDSYDPIPWIGLRRPQYVEQCNPTQVPDVDTSLFKSNNQFCFKT